MDENGAVTNKEGKDDVCTTEHVEDQTSEATGEVSSKSLDPANSSSRLTDGAPGNRLKLFNKVMEMCLQKFIGYASFHRFADTFHPLYKSNTQVHVANIHKEFIEELRKTVQEDINRLIEEGQLQRKLDELDKLEKAAKNNTEPAWRPSGAPEEDLCSFVMPYYQKQEVYLWREVKKIQQENAALAQKVQAGREAIAQTEQRIATAVDECKASVSEYQMLASSLCPPGTFLMFDLQVTRPFEYV